MKTRNKKINANVIRTLNPIDRKEKIKLFKGKNVSNNLEEFTKLFINNFLSFS